MAELHPPGCDAQAAAEMLRALAHPMRLAILCRLLDGEVPVSIFEAELGLKQPSLSQQLAHLREAGLVTTRRQSKTIIYRLDDARVAPILAVLRPLFQTRAGAVSAPTVTTAVPHPVMPAPVSRRAAPRPLPTGCGVFSQAGWPRP